MRRIYLDSTALPPKRSSDGTQPAIEKGLTGVRYWILWTSFNIHQLRGVPNPPPALEGKTVDQRAHFTDSVSWKQRYQVYPLAGCKVGWSFRGHYSRTVGTRIKMRALGQQLTGELNRLQPWTGGAVLIFFFKLTSLSLQSLWHLRGLLFKYFCRADSCPSKWMGAKDDYILSSRFTVHILHLKHVEPQESEHATGIYGLERWYICWR